MSVIFCDSNCELWFDKAEELGLKVISMPYTLKGEEYYYDLGKNTNFKAFYQAVREKNMPKTSALNEANYIEYFEPYFQKGEDILYISFSSQLSATFSFMQSAVQTLKEKYPKATFTWFDTKSISMGAGLQVYEGAKYLREGHTIPETVAFLESFRDKVSTIFMASDLNHLKRGGRLTSAAAFVGTLLSIKPIIMVNAEGKLVVKSKELGAKKAFATMVQEVIHKADISYPVVILNADDEEHASQVNQMITEKLPEIKIWQQPVGPVIGTHCGPGTIGIVYVKKEN